MVISVDLDATTALHLSVSYNPEDRLNDLSIPSPIITLYTPYLSGMVPLVVKGDINSKGSRCGLLGGSGGEGRLSRTFRSPHHVRCLDDNDGEGNSSSSNESRGMCNDDITA